MRHLIRHSYTVLTILIATFLIAAVAFASKVCPVCHRVYPDGDVVCPYDGSRLVPLATKPRKRPTVTGPHRPVRPYHTTTPSQPVVSGLSQQQKDEDLLVKATTNDLSGLKNLVNSGASIRAHTADGTTALMEAADHGSLDVATYLLANGLAVDQTNNYGWTALMFAARHANVDMVNLLHKYKASLDLKNSDGATPASIAQTAGQTEVASLLQSFTTVSVLQPGETSDQLGENLIVAASSDKLDVFQHLLQQGASINATTGDGATSLMDAADHGSVDIAKYVLTIPHVNTEAKNNIGWTAVMFAARRSNIDMMKLLLDHGCDIDARDVNGTTPLMTAIRAKQHDMVAYLISRGAGLDVKDNWENTALMIAADAGEPASVRDLIAAGANVNIKNINGLTALSRAEQNNHNEVAQIIKNAGGTE
jgi:ankyrin repeat protein